MTQEEVNEILNQQALEKIQNEFPDRDVVVEKQTHPVLGEIFIYTFEEKK